MTLEIRKNDDSILKLKLPEIPEEDIIGCYELSKEMHEVMMGKNGIGLSANQIGKKLRMFVMRNGNRTIINPTITESSDSTHLCDEGCLSFPLLYLKVNRPDWIKVKYKTFDTDGDDIRIIDVEETLIGIECQCFCHELDHLNGITFDSHVGNYALKRAKEKSAKTRKKLERKFGRNFVKELT